jgi:hypothetical protein
MNRNIGFSGIVSKDSQSPFPAVTANSEAPLEASLKPLLFFSLYPVAAV